MIFQNFYFYFYMRNKINNIEKKKKNMLRKTTKLDANA